MLENFLTDQLTFAVAIGCKPNPLGATQCLADGSELGSFVAALGRARAVQSIGPQQDWRPALPLRHHVFRFEQIEQMTFSRKNVSVPRTDGCANVFGLARFFRDDDLIGHDGLGWKIQFDSTSMGTYSEQHGGASKLRFDGFASGGNSHARAGLDIIYGAHCEGRDMTPTEHLDHLAGACASRYCRPPV